MNGGDTQHPIETGVYHVTTQPLENFVNVIVGWIKSNISGALVAGAPRIGKSFAIAFFIKNYEKWLDDSIAFVSTGVRHQIKFREEIFWKYMLTKMKASSQKTKPGDLENLFIGRLIAAANTSTSRRLVVFIDEAQNLVESAFQLLISVHNILVDNYDIRVLWILVGQPELSTIAETYIASDQTQIVGRFMSDLYVFTPICGVNEFKEAVQDYDTRLKHPIDGPSYTAAYAPVASKAGWTLGSESETIWEAFLEAKTEKGLPQSQSMTMNCFKTLIEYILRRIAPSLKPKQRLSKQNVLSAIIETNCLIHEKHDALYGFLDLKSNE